MMRLAFGVRAHVQEKRRLPALRWNHSGERRAINSRKHSYDHLCSSHSRASISSREEAIGSSFPDQLAANSPKAFLLSTDACSDRLVPANDLFRLFRLCSPVGPSPPAPTF